MGALQSRMKQIGVDPAITGEPPEEQAMSRAVMNRKDSLPPGPTREAQP